MVGGFSIIYYTHYLPRYFIVRTVCINYVMNLSVSDPDSFSTDPDPGFFPGSRQQKLGTFSKAKSKFWEKFLFSTQKVGILFLLSTNQVGILLNIELLFGRYHF